MEKNYKDIVGQVNESFRANNPDIFVSLCAEDAVWNIIGDQRLEGKKAIADFMEPTRSADSMEMGIEETIQEGNKVASTGYMMMPTKEGNKSEMRFCDLYEFEAEKIKKITSYIVEIKK